MFVLRYLPGVPLNKRKHEFATNHPTLGDAQDAHDRAPAEVRHLLQVEEREDRE